MKPKLIAAIMVAATVPAFAETTKAFVVSVPEPTTVSLLAAGVVALGLVRRKIDKATKL